jgi:putative oxidoreductase
MAGADSPGNPNADDQEGIFMAGRADSVIQGYAKACGGLNHLQGIFLLVIRLYIGWMLWRSGYHKLTNIAVTAGNFKFWGVPMPIASAYASGVVEASGGVLLVLGLAARFAAAAITCNMLVAYVTAHTENLNSLTEFFKAPPFVYLMTAIIVFIFGPGVISIDSLVARKKGLSP